MYKVRILLNIIIILSLAMTLRFLTGKKNYCVRVQRHSCTSINKFWTYTCTMHFALKLCLFQITLFQSYRKLEIWDKQSLHVISKLLGQDSNSEPLCAASQVMRWIGCLTSQSTKCKPRASQLHHSCPSTTDLKTTAFVQLWADISPFPNIKYQEYQTHWWTLS